MPHKGFVNIHILVALLCAIGVGLFAVLFLSAPDGSSEETVLPSHQQACIESAAAEADCFVIDEEHDSAPVAVRPVTAGAAAKEQPDDRPDLRVRARVVDAHTNRPLTAFRVWISRDADKLADGGWTSLPGELVRDRHGILTIGDLEEGSHALMIRCPGYRDLFVPDIAVPQAEPLLTMRVSRGTHICGTVIDNHGKPVAGARVIVSARSGDPADPERELLFKKTTDRKGFYLATGLEPGVYDVFLESAGNRGGDPADCRRSLFVAADEGLTIDLVMPVHNRIEFQVCSDSGTPLRNASVRLRAGKRRFNATTDAEGRALMERVPADTYTLSIVKGGFHPLKEEFLLRTPEGVHQARKALKPTPRSDH